VTLIITYWAARKSSGATAYFAASRQIKGWQNGFAVAGDYMSAASFLGIAGIIAFQGYDGFMYSVGWLVAYLTVLLIVAEPLRNAGKYTMADVLAYRLNPRPVRAMASLSTLTVSTFYMIAQMVGAGALVALLLPVVSYNAAVVMVGILMIVYVVFGGMLATTWVQIIKAILLMSGTILLSILVLAHFDFSFAGFFDAISRVTYTDGGATVTRDFLQPGLRFKPPYGALDVISLGMALIGSFYIMTTFLGFGAATIVGRDYIAVNGGTNMSAPLLARALGGEVFFAFVSAIAFATILAVVAGLTISASTSFAHDFYTNVIHRGVERKPGEEVRVARIAAFVVGAVSMAIAIMLGPTANVAFLVALAFAVAASANLPAIVFSLFWPRFNTAGAVAGLGTGLSASVLLILIGPSLMSPPIFPLENPGILSIPLGFLGAILGTLAVREPKAEEKFKELFVRANTGLGAERAGPGTSG
jgi:cation/acetate symporter